MDGRDGKLAATVYEPWGPSQTLPEGEGSGLGVLKGSSLKSLWGVGHPIERKQGHRRMVTVENRKEGLNILVRKYFQ